MAILVAACGRHAQESPSPVPVATTATATPHAKDTAGTTAEGGWLCFTVVQSPESPPAGTVTHLKQRRTAASPCEMASVWEQAGKRGVTRMYFHLVDGGLQAELDGGTAVMKLSDDPATPASSLLHYRNPALGLEFTEIATQIGDLLTIDSADGPPGQGQPTRQSFRRVDCSVVDAALTEAEAGTR